MDDSTGMGRETLRTYFKIFCTDVLAIYGAVYLTRRPKAEDLSCLNNCYTNYFLAECVRAVDCMKLKWKNFPFKLKEQYLNSYDGHLEKVQVEA